MDIGFGLFNSKDKPNGDKDGTKKRGTYRDCEVCQQIIQETEEEGARCLRHRPGRRLGQKDEGPRLTPDIRASIKRAFLEIPQSDYVAAIKLGLSSPNEKMRRQWVAMAALYIDGRPPDHLTVRDDRYDADEMASATKRLGDKLDSILANRLRQRQRADEEMRVEAERQASESLAASTPTDSAVVAAAPAPVEDDFY